MVKFGRFQATWNKKPNIGRVVTKVVATVLGLYVGGFVLMEIGKVLNATCSPFYKGLSLIGWTVGTNVTGSNTALYITNGCQITGTSAAVSTTTFRSDILTSVDGSGILSVVGIIALASIVLEFINFKMH